MFTIDRLSRWNRSPIAALVLPALFLAVLAGCGGGEQTTASAPEPEKAPLISPALQPFLELEGSIDIAGGTAHIPVMEEAQKRIMTANPKIRITVAGGGSGQGVKQVSAGLVTIGNTGRPLSDEEAAAAGLVSFPFAIDGVAVVVHPENPVRDLSGEQVKQIFAGKLDNWSQVGGPDGPIHLFGREEGSGTRKTFWKKCLDKGDIAASANTVASNGAMKTAVSGDPGAIGYLSIGHIDDSIAAVALDGAAPTQDNAASGAFPVTRKLYMNTKGDPDPLTRAFIDYILGDEGAEIISAAHYIPLAR